MAGQPMVVNRSRALCLQPHPDAFDESQLAAWCRAQSSAGHPVAVDLFSGAGGLSAGLESAGWSVAAAVDHDPRALETHRHNFPGLVLDLDLGDSGARDSFVERFKGVEVDLVAGGPPCQPFSRAGRSKIRSLVAAGVREETDPRRELWAAFLDVALRLRPRVVLMENVPDMGLGDDFFVVRQMIDSLEAAGYRTQVRIVDAWRYGVPQHRKRLILSARNDGRAFAWPRERASTTTLREAIGDLPSLEGDTGARVMPYVSAGAQPSWFRERMRGGAEADRIHDHMTRGVREDDLEVFRLMDSTTLYSQIPSHLRRYGAESFTDKYKRLGWGELSRSITAHIAKDGYWYIHPAQHRTLSVRESARIQTFPDAFRFAGTRSDAYRQIGNAVPPMLGEAAARSLGSGTEPARGAAEWLEAREAIAAWAGLQRAGENWFMVPGPAVTPPVALASAILTTGRTPLAAVRGPLDPFRGLAYFNTGPLASAVSASGGGRVAAALARLGPLCRKRAIWADPSAAAALTGLTRPERRVYDMLQGEDVLLRTQGALRVAARVAGTSSDTNNRLTDGRLDLARLVGGGAEAPVRMAAVRLLAETVCGAKTRRCEECPLARWCLTRSSATTVTA